MSTDPVTDAAGGPADDLPFICTTHTGGPYDHEAFLAGWALGMVDTLLAAHPGPESDRILPIEHVPIRTESLPQLDLIAMAYGCRIEVHEGEFEGRFQLITVHRDRSTG